MLLTSESLVMDKIKLNIYLSLYDDKMIIFKSIVMYMLISYDHKLSQKGVYLSTNTYISYKLLQIL